MAAPDAFKSLTMSKIRAVYLRGKCAFPQPPWVCVLFLSLTVGAALCLASPTPAAAFRDTMGREWGEPISLHEVPLDLPGSDDAEAQGGIRDVPRAPSCRQASGSLRPGREFGSPVRGEAPQPTLPASAAPVLLLVDPRLVDPALLRSNATLVTEKLEYHGHRRGYAPTPAGHRQRSHHFGASLIERFREAELRRELRGPCRSRQIHLAHRAGALRRDRPLFVTAAALVHPPRDVRRGPDRHRQRLRHSPHADPGKGQRADLRVLQRGAREGDRRRAPLPERRGRCLGRPGCLSHPERGERAGDIPPQVTEPVERLYDARELRAAGIPESALLLQRAHLSAIDIAGLGKLGGVVRDVTEEQHARQTAARAGEIVRRMRGLVRRKRRSWGPSI